jgi:hypothetical protein
MNVLTGHQRVRYPAPRFRAGLRSRPGVFTTYFRLLHSRTRQSGRPSDDTGVVPVEMRSRERLVSAVAGMSALAERPFLTGAFLLSLAVPPTGTPLCGRSAFGSSLEGIPPGTHVHLRTARGIEIRAERIILASPGGRVSRPPFSCSSPSVYEQIKIRFSKGSAGSSPAPGTILKLSLVSKHR